MIIESINLWTLTSISVTSQLIEHHPLHSSSNMNTIVASESLDEAIHHPIPTLPRVMSSSPRNSLPVLTPVIVQSYEKVMEQTPEVNNT